MLNVDAFYASKSDYKDHLHVTRPDIAPVPLARLHPVRGETWGSDIMTPCCLRLTRLPRSIS